MLAKLTVYASLLGET